MSSAGDLGRLAEGWATDYVRSLGWRVLGRNVKNRCGELDVVTLGRVQAPLDSVGPRKLRALIRAGRTLADEMGWDGPWRIDLIGVTAGRGSEGWKLEHVRDVTRGMELSL